MNKHALPRPSLAFLVVSYASLPGYRLQGRERALGTQQAGHPSRLCLRSLAALQSVLLRVWGRCVVARLPWLTVCRGGWRCSQTSGLGRASHAPQPQSHASAWLEPALGHGVMSTPCL